MALDRVAVANVFTPTKPARLTFVEREHINEKLVNALRTPGKQVIVYGHSGSGKTTLLANKLHQLYENHLTTRCIANLTFEHLTLDAFDQLGPYFEEGLKTSNKREISSSIKAEYAGLKFQVGAHIAAQADVSVKRYLPPQLTPQTLARLLGEARLCWVLEDFHKLLDAEKVKLSQVMKVFMDMADDYNDLKIVAIGAVDTARQVVEYDPEMRNRVAEIHVPLMTDDEIRSIAKKGEALLNFSLTRQVRDGIVGYTNGLAAVCHHICLNICNAAGIVDTLADPITVAEKELTKAVEQYIDEASDTIKSAFDKAFRRQRERKYDNCRLIIQALSQCPQDGATHGEILQKIRQRQADYPAGNLTNFLEELQTAERGSLFRFDVASGRYSFADPVYRTFALVFFSKSQPRRDKDIIVQFKWDAKDNEKIRHVLLLELQKWADLNSKNPK